MFKKFTSTRAVVFAAIIAAVYLVLNTLVAPIAYGPLQFRAANFLYPLVLFNPLFSLGFGLGVFLSNLGSPFGIWDIIPMPLITIIASIVAWYFRRLGWLALVIMATIISTSVSFFPLMMGGQIPFVATILPVLVSNILIVLLGWFIIWKPFYGKGIINED